MVVKSQPIIYRNSQDFDVIFENQTTFVMVRTETYITTFTWIFVEIKIIDVKCYS